MKESITFRLLKFIGIRCSESEYGNVSVWKALGKFYRKIRNTFLMKYCFNIAILAPFNSKKIRPAILRRMGCKVGKGVFIGDNVIVDTKVHHIPQDLFREGVAASGVEFSITERPCAALSK